jgi:hypothetical protein
MAIKVKRGKSRNRKKCNRLKAALKKKEKKRQGRWYK